MATTQNKPVSEEPVETRTPEQIIHDTINMLSGAERLAAFRQVLSSMLPVDIRTALEQKYMALPEDSRKTCERNYPQLFSYERYTVRQMIKEGNSKLSSNKKPGWQATLARYADNINSVVPEIRKDGEQNLLKLAEELDIKDAVYILKRYKIAKDKTSEDAHILALCKIFNISNSLLK